MATHRIALEDLEKYIRRLGRDRVLKAADDGLRKAARRAVLFLHARTAGARIYDRGYYLNGWAAEQLGHGVHRVLNRAGHAVFVEAGRRAGRKRPPSRPIFEWLMRRGLSIDEARRAVYPVATAIATRGIAGRPVLNSEPTMAAVREFVVQSIWEELGRALAE